MGSWKFRGREHVEEKAGVFLSLRQNKVIQIDRLSRVNNIYWLLYWANKEGAIFLFHFVNVNITRNIKD